MNEWKMNEREATDDKKQNKSTRVQHQAAAIACVFEDESDETNSTAIVKDTEVFWSATEVFWHSGALQIGLLLLLLLLL